MDIKISDNRITVKGKNGELKQNLPRLIAMTHQDSKITVRPVDDEIKSNALAGTLRALVQNMVRGVTDGFERKLVLVGVGYRAKAQLPYRRGNGRGGKGTRYVSGRSLWNGIFLHISRHPGERQICYKGM